jgi:hypothetical protein
METACVYAHDKSWRTTSHRWKKGLKPLNHIIFYKKVECKYKVFFISLQNL